ncbi:glycosyltransferase family 4 protein [Candidatus Woesebacteria bacterium]|nr:glycosyltransferase family 4 protein [Candidatus Woesebacteria bacterium]
MRIGIDCRLAGLQHAGIGRYTAQLVLHLIRSRSNVEWVLFCQSREQADEFIGKSPVANVRVVLAKVSHYSIAEQLYLPWIFYREQLDLLHVPHFNVPLLYLKPFVVTIHDLLWHHYRGQSVTTLQPWLYWWKYLGYRLVASASVLRAKQIFVPSQEIKQTLSKYYPSVAKKCTITYEGVELEPANNPKRALPKKYLLFVGSLYPHKNIAVVLKALQKLPSLSLLLVGSRSVFSQQVHDLVQTLGLGEQVSFFGRATETELHYLYQQATALVQPSVSEGFGLTGIEAMAAGTPVIASDIPVFHEIYQDAAVFCQPHNPEDFVSAIKNLPRKRDKLIASGTALAKKYSWKQMSSQTLAAYQAVLATA